MGSFRSNTENNTALIQHLPIAIRAIAELGLGHIALYSVYQLGLKSGLYKYLTPARPIDSCLSKKNFALQTDLITLPDRKLLQRIVPGDTLVEEANEILSGKVRLFGGDSVPLVLKNEGVLTHWIKISQESQDIKFQWESARFAWAVTLARAYHLTKNEDYTEAFWDYTYSFIESNPLNQGIHWCSAQEVALRLIALVFAIQVFANSKFSTPKNMTWLALVIAEHAERIPPTLVYARAQNNNHLISEAAGLYTAAAALPTHPKAKHWKKVGWKWLNYAFQHQISSDGTYLQHSTNYHRLILHLALWVNAIQNNAFPSEPFPTKTHALLSAATCWLYKIQDPISGKVPNLGPNDSALILPLCSCPNFDYRPVLSSAYRAFLNKSIYSPGAWDEMSEWFGLDITASLSSQAEKSSILISSPPHTIHSGDAWAYLRAVKFTSRPGHADQLHLDLWWHGLNIAQDPGTYRYTAPPPWDNSLTHTAIHNTLTVDGEEQMRRVGRFLYLNWAQAEPPRFEFAGDGSWQRLIAQHNGYRHKKITHQRSVEANSDQKWVVTDSVRGSKDNYYHQVRLQWLLPDWKFEFDESNNYQYVSIKLLSPHGWLTLKLYWSDLHKENPSEAVIWGLARSGQLIAGKGPVHPTWGWTSPNYGDKIPALSLFMTIRSKLPINIESHWSFPK